MRLLCITLLLSLPLQTNKTTAKFCGRVRKGPGNPGKYLNLAFDQYFPGLESL